jgi:hypothetical protein
MRLNRTRKFARCDDASIGETYRDRIAQLLAEKWDTANELGRLTSRDKNFEKFVLRHIDELMTPEQATKVLDNAQAHCPSGMRSLCTAIAARLRERRISN